jgi:ABC-type antimicrobial peptide transport system permease subunit
VAFRFFEEKPAGVATFGHACLMIHFAVPKDEQYLVVGGLISRGIGLLSGGAPVRRALHLNPAEALRID